MADKELTPEEKYALITDQLAEVLHDDIIKKIVLEENRSLKIYWGTATTGKPHCGYFVPMVKIAQFLRAGCSVKILLADIHGFLDNLKAPIELVQYRAEYYRFIIQSLLKAVGVSLEKLEFVLGSSYQLSAAYTMDVFRISSIVTEHDAKKAGAEVVKQVENATLSGLIYPLMQALDEQHLGVDAQFGGVDQRKIFALAQEVLPKIGYKERAHMMNPMVPGLTGGKMSASEPDSKIDLLDTPDAVTRKLKKAFAAPREVEGNGLLSFVEYVLLPLTALSSSNGKGSFTIETREGESMVFDNIESLKEADKADTVTPQLLKSGATAALNKFLAPIQADFQTSKEWQEVEMKAYPPAEPAKKKKQPKDKGSRYPGAGKVQVQADGSVEGQGKEPVSVGTGAEEAMGKLAVDGDES